VRDDSAQRLLPSTPVIFRGARRTAGVCEAHAVTGLHMGQPFGRNGKGSVDFGQRVLGLGARSKPDACWGNDAAEVISLWPIFQHGRPMLDGSGTQLRAGQVHKDFAGAVAFIHRAAKVAYHSEPRLGAVVGAVDAQAIHAVKNEIVVGGGFGRHGHHDADIATRGRRAQEDFGILFERVVPSPIVGVPSGKSRDPPQSPQVDEVLSLQRAGLP
jgi:hypothetical protein